MISIIIPFHNEEDNLPILVNQLIRVADKNSLKYEIILVDDGSNDNSEFRIQNSEFFQAKKIKLLIHKKRLGKGEALNTGIKNAKGEILVFMDADLQNDPEDLPKLLNKIDEGYDFVNGIRKGRHADNTILKSYSFLAEKFLKKFIGSPFTDINCGLQIFKKELLKEFTFYGNNFRFFPLAVFYNGHKVTEIEVNDHKRKFGRSKFGPGKLITGIFDTLTAFFIYKFSESPLHFFGIIGAMLFAVGFIISLILAIERLFFGVLLYQRPILWLGLSLIIVGIQIIMTGIIAELIVYLNKKRVN